MYRRSRQVMQYASLHVIFTMAMGYWYIINSAGPMCLNNVPVPHGLELINIVPGLHEGPAALLFRTDKIFFMDSRNTRQQIYDQIRATSKDEYILEEMKRLGFWAKSDDQPALSELMIKKEADLQRSINTLLAEKQRYNNREQVLRDLRAKRMQEAKQKRIQTREKRELQRNEKAAQWALTREKDILFLGEEVSAGLQEVANNTAALLKYGLPAFNSAEALAMAMQISISELKFLSFHRRVTTTTHYQRFSIRKKSGGHRVISAPMPRLKKAQHWILENILNKVTHHPAANGFVTGRSILTNAASHIGKQTVLNIDLKDFFPTVHFKRVKGMFVKLGYAEKIATILALICTEPSREEVALDGKRYYVATGERFLPQGAPTSPAITNIICYKLDCRFSGIARSWGAVYTRYADDLSFSFDVSAGNSPQLIQQLLWRANRVIREEGFIIHPDKIKVMGKGTRQEVTGIVVNEKPGINRKTLHRFRALIQQIEKTGLTGKHWKGGTNIVSEMTGYANFIVQVKPEQGKKLQQRLHAVFTLPHIQQQLKQMASIKIQSSPKNSSAPDSDLPGENKDWWKVL